MKTLYISDLDGTLLNSDAQITQFTAETLNTLIEKGLLFSYATARSYVTAGQLTKDITAHFPLVLYNGAFVIDNVTKQPIITNFFEDKDVWSVVKTLLAHNVYPLVYHYKDSTEKIAYMEEKSTQEMKDFLATRQGDVRCKPINDEKDFYCKDIYYITCIDSEEKLYPLYLLLKDNPAANVIYQKDVYSGRQWLELMPKAASKANAVLMLKEKLGADRVVCFGDGKNDISMFNVCDEKYAVANAVDELKAIATAVIGSNNDNGVAKWLLENGEN